jgi:predicted NAD/FAD-binding protein
MSARLDIAVVGSGVAGLGAAWLLAKRHNVTLYEKQARFGGHTNTVTVAARGLDGGTRELPVDTGFIVYNDATYPDLIALFDHLGIASETSNMSFSASIDRGRVEYSGGSWTGLFAQKRNLVRLDHWRMLGDCVRFFRDARTLCESEGSDPDLGTFLRHGGYSRAFVDNHLLPMAAAIWSCPVSAMMAFPAPSLARFFNNHGLLQLFDRPLWRTVKGGSHVYRERLLGDIGPTTHAATGVVRVIPAADGVTIHDTFGRARRYDRVVMAAHADETLALLGDATPAERDVLGAFAFQPNRAVLHQDPALMPVRKRAWASWNYLAERSKGEPDVSVTYWMNRLQNLPADFPLFVSLNPIHEPRAGSVLAEFDYMHPVFDAAAIAAQRRLPEIQGQRGLYFCGAWTGHGFHEDGLRSGLDVAEMMGVRRPWLAAAGLDAKFAAD